MGAVAFPLRFDRRFQLWSYNVSHGVLLLRSNRTGGSPTRVDLMFRAVTEIRLRHRISDLSLDNVDEDGDALFRLGIQDRGDRHVFLISSEEFDDGYVVAGSMYMSEDDLSDGEPSSIDDDDLADRVIRSGYFQ